MRGSRSTDYDWIIYDIIYILITLAADSREPGLQASANRTQLLTGDSVQTDLEFKQQPWIEFQWGGGGQEGWGLRWIWRGMGLQTSLGKWINPRLCHPAGLMCCVSVKQLDGGHLYPSDQSSPAEQANLKALLGLTEDSPAQKKPWGVPDLRCPKVIHTSIIAPKMTDMAF